MARLPGPALWSRSSASWVRVAPGAVAALAGVFLIIAAVRFSPSRAEGVDGSLRAFAHTPLGPFLLILVALELVAFGLFSWCEARWRPP